jgi:hypothetical protein
MAFRFSAPEPILYERPYEWPRLNVGSNEMVYLVSDLTPYTAFQIAKTGVGNTYVDWGDGVIESNSGSWVAEHVYTTGGTVVTNDRYPTYKVWVVRIYCDAGVTLTNARPYKNASDASGKTFNSFIFGSVLEAYFGTNPDIPLNTWFSISTNAGINCKYLRYIKLPSVYTAGTLSSFFNGTSSSDLERIDLPSSTENDILGISNMLQSHDNNFKLQSLVFPQDCTINNVAGAFNIGGLKELVLPTSLDFTSLNGTFTACRSLELIDISRNVGVITTLQSAFQNCVSVKEIRLPSNISLNLSTALTTAFNNCNSLYELDLSSVIVGSAVTGLANTFQNCSAITSIVMPAGNGTGITSMSSTFSGCSNLKTLNFNGFASTNTNQIDANTAFLSCFRLDNLSIPFRMSRFALNGNSSTTKVDLSSLRFTNTASTFAGTSPQINVSYTNLSTAALVTLFNDIAATAATAGKTINITGATGAAGLTAGDRAILTSKGWTITG